MRSGDSFSGAQRENGGEPHPPVRLGERFRARTDMSVKVLTHWSAPFTGGHTATLPAGTVVVATDDQVPGFPGFNCIPEEYATLESTLVPESDRTEETYDSYSLSFVLDDIGPSLESLGG